MGCPRTPSTNGASLCCGFFVLHASPRVERFVADWIERSRQHGHDQLALNNLLLDRELRWQRDDGSQTVGSCSSLGLRVGAINEDLISRETVSPSVQIYHPYLSSKSESNKLLQLKARVEPTRMRRMSAYIRLALNMSAWPEAVLGKSRRVLRRAEEPQRSDGELEPRQNVSRPRQSLYKCRRSGASAYLRRSCSTRSRA